MAVIDEMASRETQIEYLTSDAEACHRVHWELPQGLKTCVFYASLQASDDDQCLGLAGVLGLHVPGKDLFRAYIANAAYAHVAC